MSWVIISNLIDDTITRANVPFTLQTQTRKRNGEGEIMEITNAIKIKKCKSLLHGKLLILYISLIQDLLPILFNPPPPPPPIQKFKQTKFIFKPKNVNLYAFTQPIFPFICWINFYRRNNLTVIWHINGSSHILISNIKPIRAAKIKYSITICKLHYNKNEDAISIKFKKIGILLFPRWMTIPRVYQ